MSKLAWDDSGNRLYSAGVDRGVLYPRHGDPVVWNGLTSIVEAPSDVVIEATYFDGVKKHRSTTGTFAATINAFTFPDSLMEYDGIGDLRNPRNLRKEFDFSYRTLIGNDTEGLEHGTLIHLVYNAMATPAQPSYNSINAGTETSDFSWALSTRPVKITGHKSSAHLIVNTALAYPWAVSEFEDILYGTDTTKPRFPTADEVLDLFEDASIVKITDNGDGTWTAEGPDYAVYMTGLTQFEIAWPSAVYIDSESYTVSSL